MFLFQTGFRDVEVVYPILDKPIQTILIPNKVIKYTLREGAGSSPKLGQIIHAFYTCHLISGKQVANSKDSLCKFQVGYHRLVQGLQIALMTVKPKEKCRIIVAPQYAYEGRSGTKLIPKGSKLIFTFDVVQILDSAKTYKGENQMLAKGHFHIEKSEQLIKHREYQKALEQIFMAYQAFKEIKYSKCKIRIDVLIKAARILMYLNKSQDALQVISVLLHQEPFNLTGNRLKLQIYNSKGKQMQLSVQLKQLYNKFSGSKQFARFYIDFLKASKQDEELKSLKNYDHKRDAFFDEIFEKKCKEKKGKKEEERGQFVNKFPSNEAYMF